VHRRFTPLLLALALALALTLGLGACGDDGGGDDTGPPVDADATTTSAATDDTEAPGGELSVADAVEQPDGTQVTVLGYVFQPEEGATIMCDLLAESFPPTCSGPTLTTDGLDVSSLPGLQTTAPGDLVAPATWTTEPVPVTGTLTAGRLLVG
jgi:hypothetical protein